jgi:hypothetical protein
MRQIMTVIAAAALAALAACNSPQSEPEPANESTAAAMPETPDLSDTAADENAAGVTTPAPTAEEQMVQPGAADAPAAQ